MGRYLTPSKITLLVLALVYTEGVIPLNSSIHVLSFMVKSILPDLKLSASEVETFNGVLPINSFETNLSKHPSSTPGRSVWDLLLRKLWAIDCSDALDAFITNLPALLAKSREQLLKERDTGEISDTPSGKVVSTSPLGAFIRRCHLEYTRLQFQDSVAIWQDLIAFRASTRGAYEKKNPPDDRNPLDANLSDLDINTSHPLVQIMFGHITESQYYDQSPFSSHDVEKLLEFQVSELQRLGGRLPETMRQNLDKMSKHGTPLPKLAHYIKFLDTWRAGDYSSAFDNLHRYFDYTMQSRDRTFYQYALLNLAILQADFGCHSEAVPAMQEAIATARENRDTTCLNFCMSWLYHFGRAFPTQMKALYDSGILGNEIEGLAFLKSRAKDAEMWSLLSSTLLSEAKLGLQQGQSLAIVFENIVKSTHINHVKAVTNVTGPVLLMKASVFSRIGQTHLAWSCGETFLQCYSQDGPIEDVLKCSCRMASLLAQQGRYTEAETMMDSVPGHILKVLKYQNYWTFHSDLLRLRRFLHRDDLNAAERIVERLKGQGVIDIDMTHVLALGEIDLETRKGDLSVALNLVEDLADKSQTENHDVLMQIKLLTLKAGLLAKAGTPSKGFTVAMRAVNMAYTARLLPALWNAIGHLSYILLELQEFVAVKDLLKAIMPQVLEAQDCDLTACTHSLLADAHMGLAGLAEEKSLKRKEFVSSAMNHIDAAFEQYKFVEDLQGQLEMLSKKARILHWRGDLVLADDMASRYLEVRKKYMEERV